ncbi:MAG TPA: FixH family protein [Acidimicrobiales bacterium]|nr:FixH family protein [Acidimicrobiales bacterium]
MTLRLRLAAGVLAAVALLTVGAAAPATAHEGDGVVTIEEVHPAGASVHYIVRVTWENDGHPAADATVTATVVMPDGETLTPVVLAPADDDGRYAGAVEYPGAGSYTIRITSIDPTGTAEQTEDVSASPSTVPPDVTAPGSEATTATAPEAGTGFAPADDGTGDETAGETGDDAAAPADDGDDGMPVWLIALAAVVVIGGAVAAVGVVRRYRGPGTGGRGGSGNGSTGNTGGGRGAGSGEPVEAATPATPGTPGTDGS